jgi:hypothetical protein
LSEQSTEVDRKRKHEEEVWRAKLAVKKAVWQVNNAISGKQISDETAVTAMRLLKWEADRPAPIRMRAAAPEPPPRPLENGYRALAPMHLGPDPRDLTGEGVWRNGMYFSGGYSPFEGEEERELERQRDLELERVLLKRVSMLEHSVLAKQACKDPFDVLKHRMENLEYFLLKPEHHGRLDMEERMTMLEAAAASQLIE